MLRNANVVNVAASEAPSSSAAGPSCAPGEWFLGSSVQSAHPFSLSALSPLFASTPGFLTTGTDLHLL